MRKGQLNLFYYIARINHNTKYFYHNYENPEYRYVWEDYTNFKIGDHYEIY